MLLSISNTIGLTIGEIIAIIMMFSALVTTWVNARVEISKMETEIRIRFAKLEEDLITHKTENEKDFEKYHKENREDHGNIIEKLDKVVETVTDMKIEINKKL